jgi:hypothetical protein
MLDFVKKPSIHIQCASIKLFNGMEKNKELYLNQKH